MSHEYHLPSHAVILSTSDLTGNITSFNKAFLEASGYSEAEIKGKPHSILRHPDMPKEAFKDLWNTISDGRPWFGLVKNKRKNGDYYWVAANASPVFKAGQITGYVSVRYPATNEQKALGEQLYGQIRNRQKSMPWTPKMTLDKLGLIGLGVGFVGVLLPYLSLGNLAQAVSSLLILSGFGLSAWRGYVLSRPNQTQITAIQNLSNGQFKEPIVGNDVWTNTLNLLRTRIGQNASDTLDAARESAMLTTAMNAASTNLMVADNDFNIVSINNSLAQMFQRNEAELQTALPNFKATAIVGSNMDIFHKDPSHQRAMVEKLTSTWHGRLQVANLSLDLTIVPVINLGQRQGFVVEWRDVTAQCRIQSQLAMAIHNANTGILNNRIETQGQEGFYLQVGQGINTLLDGLYQFMSKTIFNLGEIASNRLGGTLDGKYEGSYLMTQNAVNVALTGLNEMVGQVQFSTNLVNTAMHQLAQGVNNFSGQVQQQASAIEQTAAATHEMLSSVQQNMITISQANDISHDVAKQAVNSSTIMDQAIVAMQAVEASGQKIGDIVGLIESIAFQTNLLALNAAVEAARAGEHGRGFAVVASEVRALAGKSADAAKDIKHLIETSVEQIGEGSLRAREAGDALQKISASITQVSNIIHDVSSSSKEQEKAIKEVTQAMNVMDGVAQQSAALVEETAASAAQVADNMEELNQLVSLFKLSPAAQKISQFGRSPLSQMKQEPSRVRLRLSNFLSGYEQNINIADIANPSLCALGQWRRAVGTQYDHLPAMLELDSAHTRFHQEIAKAFSAAQKQEHQSIHSMMPTIDALSNQIVSLLEQVEQHVDRHSAPTFVQKVAAAKSRAALPAPRNSKGEEWSDF